MQKYSMSADSKTMLTFTFIVSGLLITLHQEGKVGQTTRTPSPPPPNPPPTNLKSLILQENKVKKKKNHILVEKYIVLSVYFKIITQ